MNKLRTVSYFTLALLCGLPLLGGCLDEDRRTANALGSDSVDGAEEQGTTESHTEGGAGATGLGGATSISMTDTVCAGLDCGPHASCSAEGGTATCECLAGFTGPDCIDINECADEDRCGPLGFCVNYPGTFRCECPIGLRATASGCEDVDECEEGSHACDAKASCTNVEGSHLCTCEPGRYGDGTFCKDVDHCVNKPCGSGSCSNTPNGFACSCPLGTSGTSCQSTCPVDEPIVFSSDILEAAVRAAAGLAPEQGLTPASLGGVTSLTVPPPDGSLDTDDVVNSLDGLECWPTLQYLDLKGHQTQDLTALEGLADLRSLDLQCTQSSDLSPLSRLSELRTLNLSRTALCGTTQRSPVDLGFLSELTRLEALEANGWGLVADLGPAAHLARVETLGLRAVGVSDISALSSLSQLRRVSLAENPIEELAPLSELGGLRSLDLASTSILSVGALSSLDELEELNVSYNNLTSAQALAALQALRVAYLDGNDLPDLSAFAKHQQLLWLDVSDNQLKSVSSLAQNVFFSGGHLRLDNNPLDCAQASDDLYALASRGVSVASSCGSSD